MLMSTAQVPHYVLTFCCSHEVCHGSFLQLVSPASCLAKTKNISVSQRRSKSIVGSDMHVFNLNPQSAFGPKFSTDQSLVRGSRGIGHSQVSGVKLCSGVICEKLGPCGHLVQVRAAKKKGGDQRGERESGTEVKLNANDLMELQFGRLLGDDNQTTLAKVVGKKLNPDISYVEMEKKKRARTALIQSSSPVKEGIVKKLPAGEFSVNNSKDTLPNLVSPPVRPISAVNETIQSTKSRFIPPVQYSAAKPSQFLTGNEFDGLARKPVRFHTSPTILPKVIAPMLMRRTQEDPNRRGELPPSTFDKFLRRPQEMIRTSQIPAESADNKPENVEMSVHNRFADTPESLVKGGHRVEAKAWISTLETAPYVRSWPKRDVPMLEEKPVTTDKFTVEQLLAATEVQPSSALVSVELNDSFVPSKRKVAKARSKNELLLPPLQRPSLSVKKVSSVNVPVQLTVPLIPPASDSPLDPYPMTTSDSTKHLINSFADSKASNIQQQYHESTLDLAGLNHLTDHVQLKYEEDGPMRFLVEEMSGSNGSGEPIHLELTAPTNAYTPLHVINVERRKTSLRQPGVDQDHVNHSSTSAESFNTDIRERVLRLSKPSIPPNRGALGPIFIPSPQRGKSLEVKLKKAISQGTSNTVVLNKEEEDQDWARAEALYDSKTVEEVLIVGCAGGGMLVSFGSLAGYLPEWELSSKRRAPSFIKWKESRGYNGSGGENGLKDHWVEHLKKSQAENETLTISCQSSLEERSTINKERGANLLMSYKMERESILSLLIGQKVKVIVTSVDRAGRQLRFSEKQGEAEDQQLAQKKARLMESLCVGDVVRCQVKKVTKFGAFVEVQGVPALIHVSELSWNRNADPLSVVEVGEDIEVKVCRLDHFLQRINLSLKQLQHDPLLETLESFSLEDAGSPTQNRLQVSEPS